MNFDELMKRAETKLVDRRGWPSGPWDREPDKLGWEDKNTGLNCLILRNEYGALCGYVGVTKEHQLYEKEGDCIGFSVHGNLNYSGFIKDSPNWYFGFDCCHYDDFYPAKDGDMPKGIYKDIEFVRGECASLAKQLAEWKKEE